MPLQGRVAQVSLEIRPAGSAAWNDVLYTHARGEVWVEAHPGAAFRVRVVNQESGRKAVAMWVDGELTSPRGAWLEPWSTLLLEGFRRSAKPEFAADVIPFQFSEVKVCTGSAAGAAPPPETVGVITIKIYDVVRTAPYSFNVHVPAAYRPATVAVGAVGSEKEALRLGVAAALPTAKDVDTQTFQATSHFRLDEHSVDVFSIKYRDRAALILLGILPGAADARSGPAAVAGAKRDRSQAPSDSEAAGSSQRTAAVELIDLSKDARARGSVQLQRAAAVELVDLSEDASAPRIVPMQKLRVCANDGQFLARDILLRRPAAGASSSTARTTFDWSELRPFTAECESALGMDSVKRIWDQDGNELYSLESLFRAVRVVVGRGAHEAFVPAKLCAIRSDV